MREKKSNMNMTEKQLNAAFEGLWLTYFNDTLYAKGVIPESERNKMRNMIIKRTAERAR